VKDLEVTNAMLSNAEETKGDRSNTHNLDLEPKGMYAAIK
jgi:hypothetical protein